MQNITIEKFREHCNKKYCLRHTFTNDKCLTESKQDSCYIRYGVVSEKQQVRQEEFRNKFRERQTEKAKQSTSPFPKSSLTRERLIHERKERAKKLKEQGEVIGEKQKSKDARWSEVKTKLFERDSGCRVWQCLTQNERALVLASFYDQIMMFKDIDDAAHIKPRSTHPELYYDLDNLLRINRYFHTLLDTYRNPISQAHMSKEEHDMWFRRIKNNGNKLEPENETNLN